MIIAICLDWKPKYAFSSWLFESFDSVQNKVGFIPRSWTSGSGSRLEGMAVDEKPPPAVLISVRNAWGCIYINSLLKCSHSHSDFNIFLACEFKNFVFGFSYKLEMKRC